MNITFEKMKVFRRGLNALRLIENGAKYAGRIIDDVLKTIKENGWDEEEFWQYAANH